jgi:hypothetical protein
LEGAEVSTPVLFTIVALLAVGEFLLFGALAEAYRDIKQIREVSGLIDRPMPVDLGQARDKAPSRLGLHPELDSAVHAVAVYLDNRCGTCQSIVSSINGGIPEGIWLVIIAESAEKAFAWLGSAGLNEGSAAARRVIVTSPEEAEQHLGGVATPLAIEIEHGRLVRARIVTSVRQFYGLVPATRTLVPQIPEGVTG